MNGLIFGKFAPFHLGHIHLINTALTYCDTLIILVSYDEKFNALLDERFKHTLSLDNRLNVIKKYYQDIEHVNVIVDYVDESKLSAYPHGWDDYQLLLKDKCDIQLNQQPDCIFTSEPSYDDKLKEYFPNTNHIMVDPDRNTVNISATKLRNNVYYYWEYLPLLLRQQLSYKVCIIGTESCGKTTLCKLLSKVYNTEYVEEYGRVFVEEYLDCDETLLVDYHYDMIASQHRANIDKQISNGDRVTIIDTNASITGYYQILYEGGISPIVHEHIKNEYYDLVLFLNDDVEWVNDGMRQSGDNRSETKQLLKELLLQYGIDYTIIDGSYTERYKKALSIINEQLDGHT